MIAFPPPALMPKVRSKKLRDACQHMPCNLRVASFVGLPCADQATVVGCHLSTAGKGMSTKDSDLSMAAGCSICHAIVDRTHEGWKVIAQRYPGAFQERLRLANQETIAMWVMMDLIKIEGAE